MERLPAWVRSRSFIILAICVLLVAGAAYVSVEKGKITLPILGYPEVEELAHGSYTFQEYQDYFRRLSERKGGVYAFEILQRAPFPPGVDLHLLGHTIGDMLYKEKGIDAIRFCTDAFRNACSHSVVIDILTEHGEGSLKQIAEVCKDAPGGKGAYTMCFHGLGHGVLAYNGYDLEKGVGMCRKTGTAEYHDREYIECVGGMIMEMIAGVHDPIAWQKQQEKYFKEDDPLYPCDGSIIPQEAKGICYTYLTPHLFTSAGGDLGTLKPEIFPEAFSYCAALPRDASTERDACYGGFGKEFVVAAQGRDIRNVGQSDERALRTVRSWCALAGTDAGRASCDRAALSSLFWGGENPADAAIGYCAIAQENLQPSCYRELGDQVKYYLDGSARERVCVRFPEAYQARCQK